MVHCAKMLSKEITICIFAGTERNACLGPFKINEVAFTMYSLLENHYEDTPIQIN